MELQMPRYDFRCKSCGEIWEETLKISEYKTPLSNACPKCGVAGEVEHYHGSAPQLIDPVKLGNTKLPTGFNQVLNNIGTRTGQQVNHSFSTRKEI